jgi:methylglyoxal reductase
MVYREIGKSGIEASAVALGTWAIGGGPWWGKTDDAESIKAIHAALDEGINLVDTAPGYGFGRSEEVVGKAISDRRDKVILSTKCGLWWGDEKGSFKFELSGIRVNISLHPETIRKELEISLKRLQTDYIDLYHTHWQAIDPDKTPIGETMDCLMDLKKEGKIRAIAVSNVTLDDIKAYMQTGTLDAVQMRYSILDRKLEGEMLPFCRENDISVLAYSPLEQGLLTGKIGMDRKFSEGEYRNNLPWLKLENRKKVLDMLESWSDLLKKYSCSMAQLVIAWTMNQPGSSHILCGSRHAAQARDNAGAGSIDLSPEDAGRMRKDAEGLGDPL